ncbi:hypothetical protein AAMO2058_000829300 [Amorphochlora amoebiformis]
MAQLVNASRLHREDRPFESGYGHYYFLLWQIGRVLLTWMKLANLILPKLSESIYNTKCTIQDATVWRSWLTRLVYTEKIVRSNRAMEFSTHFGLLVKSSPR